jgi:hypothetical protein
LQSFSDLCAPGDCSGFLRPTGRQPVTRNNICGLENRGLVSIKDMKKTGERVVKITAAGKKALKGA